MNEAFQIFTNEKFGEIRGFWHGNEPWLVGKDVATALGYAKPENAVAAHVDEEDKTLTLIQGGCSSGKQQTTIINESGLYSLIFASQLPNAKEFKHWVTAEVLPAIRKTGSYNTQSQTISVLEYQQAQNATTPASMCVP